MSQEAVAWARDQDIPDPIAKLLLMVIASFADNNDWTAWPGQTRLSEINGRSLDTVQRKLDYLEQRKLIIRERRNTKTGRRTSNKYHLSKPHSSAIWSKPQNSAAKVEGSKPHSCAVLVKPHSYAAGTISSELSDKVELASRDSLDVEAGRRGEVAAADPQKDSRQDLIRSLADLPSPNAPPADQAEKIIAAQVSDFGEPIVKQALGRLRTRLLGGETIPKPARILQLICEDIRRERCQRSPNLHAPHGYSRCGG